MFSNLNILKKILDTIEEGVLVTDQNGKITAFNQPALKILELKKAQLINSDLIHPKYKQISVAGKELSLNELPSSITRNTGKVLRDFTMGLKISQEKVKWLSINTQKLSFDNVDYVISTFLDVTAKYKLQRDIRRTREKFKYALKGSEIGVWEFNAETNDLYFSDEWKKIVGNDPTDVINAFEQWTEAVHPEDKDFVMKIVNDCINNISTGFKIEYRLFKNGAIIWISAIGKIMSRMEDGTPKRFSGTIRDITEKKKIEELLKANEEKFKTLFIIQPQELGL